MSKSRLEAFSDGVLAVLITIMVLDLRPPAGHEFSDLSPLFPKVLVYALSFAFLAIYWNNHHHLMHVVEHISGAVLWANSLLLFWLSLTPAATAWLGPNVHDRAPVVAYGVVLFGSAVAYFVLTRTLLSIHAPEFAAGGRDRSRLEGQALRSRLPRCNRGGVRRTLAVHRDLRRRRHRVAHPRPAYRARRRSFA